MTPKLCDDSVHANGLTAKQLDARNLQLLPHALMWSVLEQEWHRIRDIRCNSRGSVEYFPITKPAERLFMNYEAFACQHKFYEEGTEFLPQEETTRLPNGLQLYQTKKQALCVGLFVWLGYGAPFITTDLRESRWHCIWLVEGSDTDVYGRVVLFPSNIQAVYGNTRGMLMRDFRNSYLFPGELGCPVLPPKLQVLK